MLAATGFASLLVNLESMRRPCIILYIQMRSRGIHLRTREKCRSRWRAASYGIWRSPLTNFTVSFWALGNPGREWGRMLALHFKIQASRWSTLITNRYRTHSYKWSDQFSKLELGRTRFSCACMLSGIGRRWRGVCSVIQWNDVQITSRNACMASGRHVKCHGFFIPAHTCSQLGGHHSCPQWLTHFTRPG